MRAHSFTARGAMTDNHNPVQEPLAESAPLAWAEAPRRCVTARSGESCLAYHRVWQYLRMLEIISSTSINSDFLLQTFRDRARTHLYPRVLVSATADYSMLAHLRCAYLAERAAFDPAVIDRCDTALFLNQWYAARYGFSLRSTRIEIQDYVPAEQFDLVCTHNFLSRFDPVSRKRVVARWHGLLRQGGMVVTTQRVQPDATAERNIHTEESARALSDRTLDAVRALPRPLAVDAGELAKAAYEYALKQQTFVIRSNHEVVDLFDAAGFDLELADEGGGVAERERDRPLFPRAHSYRMRIIARKR